MVFVVLITCYNPSNHNPCSALVLHGIQTCDVDRCGVVELTLSKARDLHATKFGDAPQTSATRNRPGSMAEHGELFMIAYGICSY